VERITATTYVPGTFDATPGEVEYVQLSARSGAAGNVVISGLPVTTTWREGSTTFASGVRFSLAAGRYQTTGPQLGGRPKLCGPLAFAVTTTTKLTYVRVALAPPERDAICYRVTSVRTQLLPVPAREP
jgi:hypothetical protein